MYKFLRKKIFKTQKKLIKLGGKHSVSSASEEGHVKKVKKNWFKCVIL